MVCFVRMLEDVLLRNFAEGAEETLVFAFSRGRLGGNLCFFWESRHTGRHVEDMCLRSFSDVSPIAFVQISPWTFEFWLNIRSHQNFNSGIFTQPEAVHTLVDQLFCTSSPTEEDLPCGLRGGYPLCHDQRTHRVGEMLGADEFEKQGHINGGSVPFLWNTWEVWKFEEWRRFG